MILVSGATGNVGGELVPQLLAAGQKVRVLTRDHGKAAHLGTQVETVAGDMDKPQTLASALDGVRAVYLVARSDQVATMVTAARQAGVQHIVRQSTMEAGFDPPVGPGRWHRAAELATERSGLAWTHLRPTMMMVNTSDWWAPGIRTSRTVRFPGGLGRISPVDPRDIAATACAVLTQPGHHGRAYDVTGPQLLTIGEMVAILSRVLGQDIRYIDVPETEAGAWMAQSGAPPTVVAALLETLAGIRANKFAHIADTVARLTGHPGHTYQTWCQEHADAFQPPADQMP
jgi:(4-alkanoyl-5-oxo-2,5-dihydrofuran-3-yl)methyl phosphate reductase